MINYKMFWHLGLSKTLVRKVTIKSRATPFWRRKEWDCVKLGNGKYHLGNQIFWLLFICHCVDTILTPVLKNPFWVWEQREGRKQKNKKLEGNC